MTPIAIQTAISPAEEISFAMPKRAQLPRLARQGVAWSSALLLGKYMLSIVSTAVLARLLNPGDYGLLAMVATITVLGQAISDFGLSWATVPRENLQRNQIDALFWINCAFGLFLAGMCCLAAPAVATFYHRPELTNIVCAASGTLFLSAVAVQPNALLLRQMKLKELNLCGFYSLTISAVVTIVMAQLGYGYWALVVQLLLQQGIVTVLSFPMSGYFPRLPQHLANLGTLLTFGGYATLYGIVNYFARNLDNVLVGRFWGPVALGYYSRAYFLMTLPGMIVIGIFSGTLIPAMASLRKEPERMEAVYLRAVRSITSIGLFFRSGFGCGRTRGGSDCLRLALDCRNAYSFVALSGEHSSADPKYIAMALHRGRARTWHVPHGPIRRGFRHTGVRFGNSFGTARGCARIRHRQHDHRLPDPSDGASSLCSANKEDRWRSSPVFILCTTDGGSGLSRGNWIRCGRHSGEDPPADKGGHRNRRLRCLPPALCPVRVLRAYQLRISSLTHVMNIGFICNELAPANVGGIGTFTVELIRGLNDSGHRVHVVSLDRQISETNCEIMSPNLTIHRVRGRKGRLRGYLNRFKLFSLIRKLALQGQIDIVEVPDFEGWCAGWPHLPIPVVVRLHGSVSFFAAEMRRAIPRSVRISGTPGDSARRSHCLGESLRSRSIARGYRTADVANHCSQQRDAPRFGSRENRFPKSRRGLLHRNSDGQERCVLLGAGMAAREETPAECKPHDDRPRWTA